MKKYVQLSKSDANLLFNLYKQDNVTPEIIEQKISGKKDNELQLQKVSNIASRSLEIVEKYDDINKENQEFDQEFAIFLHKEVNKETFPIEALTDADFWRVFPFIESCALARTIEMRFKKNLGEAERNHYQLERLNNGYLSTLWLRAEITYEPDNSDPYHITKVPQMEIWHSHIMGQTFSSCREFAKAFIEYVEDHALPNGKTDDLENNGQRDLVSELRRRFATTSYETMSKEQAYEFIDSVWKDVHIWKKALLNK